MSRAILRMMPYLRLSPDALREVPGRPAARQGVQPDPACFEEQSSGDNSAEMPSARPPPGRRGRRSRRPVRRAGPTVFSRIVERYNLRLEE